MPKLFELPSRLRAEPATSAGCRQDHRDAKNLAEDINVRLSGTQPRRARRRAGRTRGRDRGAGTASTPARSSRSGRSPPWRSALVLLGLCYLARHIHARWEFGTINNVFDALNTGFDLLVLLAGALWFCVTFEARIKRKEALGFIEELRGVRPRHRRDSALLHPRPLPTPLRSPAQQPGHRRDLPRSIARRCSP